MPVAALFERWNALPRAMRVAISACMPAVLLAALAAGLVLHPSRAALFPAPLHAEQLAEVEERLASWHVAFTPAADNVLVDVKRRSEVLLRLSIAGVPHPHVDATGDVLGKLGALTPQAVIDAQTRDGLAGDIELALRGIDGVQDATVIVAPAKPGYFADESSRAATASVRLRLLPGAHLSRDAVSGIRSFVAASVPGLDARSVTIVDDRGVALGDGASDDDAADLERSLQSALDAAIGAGASIVRVHVDYDTRAIVSKEVRRSPLGAPAITATTQNEMYRAKEKQYDRREQQIDRGSDTSEMTASSPPGRIARISAAVLVDASRGVDLTQVKALARASLGIDSRRGDDVVVQAVSFHHALVQKRDAWWLAYGAIVPLLPTLAILIAALTVLRWARAPFASALKVLCERAATAKTADAVRGIPAANVRGALMNEPPHAAAAIISALPAATAAAVLDMYPERERAAIIRRMQRPVPPLLSDAESFIANA